MISLLTHTYILYFFSVIPLPKNRTKFFPVPIHIAFKISLTISQINAYHSFSMPCNFSTVHVTLDPPKDESKIVISEDRRQMRMSSFALFLRMSNDYDQFGVLGSPFITSGKHYWEVDVSEVRACVLGVCGEKLPGSNMKSFVRQGNKCQHVCSRYQPKHGYWVIGLENKLEHNASVESSSSDPLKLTLSLTFSPRRVGVFLDYDAGTLSFFNITNHEFLIYKYSSCSFPQKLFPYFNMKCTGPMILCSPSS